MRKYAKCSLNLVYLKSQDNILISGGLLSILGSIFSTQDNHVGPINMVRSFALKRGTATVTFCINNNYVSMAQKTVRIMLSRQYKLRGHSHWEADLDTALDFTSHRAPRNVLCRPAFRTLPLVLHQLLVSTLKTPKSFRPRFR